MLGSQYLGQIVLAATLVGNPAPRFTGGAGLGTCHLGGIVLGAGCVVQDIIPPPVPPPEPTDEGSGGGGDGERRRRRQKQMEVMMISFLNTQQ